MTRAMIEVRSLSKAFGASPVLQALSLDIHAGELLVLVGSSGSGKSTLLRLLNRLLEPDRGSIHLQGEDIRLCAPELLRRRLGYVIQSVGLFPHWTVAENIGAVPQLLGWPKARIRARVDALLALLQLPAAAYAQRYPHELSGGQQQRVGVARALAADPDVLLMDEPFAALDPLTRSSLQQALREIHARSGKTIVLVTHDIDEALRLGTRLVLLDQGRIVQQGTPQAILRAPANDWVREFVGQGEAGLRLLGLQTVGERMRANERVAGEPIASHCSLREALSLFVSRQVDCLPVADESGQLIGSLHFSDLIGGDR